MGQQNADGHGFPFPALFWWGMAVFVLVCVIMAASVVQGATPTANQTVASASTTRQAKVQNDTTTPFLASTPTATETPAPASDLPATYAVQPVEPDARDRAQFRNAGFVVPTEFSVLADNCDDMETGGDGMAVLTFEAPVSAASRERLQDLYKALAVKYICPEHKAAMGKGSSAQYKALVHASEQEALEREQYAGMTHEEWIETQVLISKYRGTGAGSGGGYPVSCNDGWVSKSGGKQGACSWHGGTQ